MESHSSAFVPDLRELIPAANAEDLAAQSTLLALVGELVLKNRYLQLVHLADRDDVQQEVYTRVLPCRFDPDRALRPDDAPEDAPAIIQARFATYIRKIVRSVVVDRYGAEQLERAKQARLVLQLEADGSTPELSPLLGLRGRDVTARLPDELIHPLLTDKQWAVFCLRREGFSTKEICRELGLAHSAVTMLSTRIRRTIESKVLLPAGLRPLTSFENRAALLEDIYSGILPGVEILQRWYTRDEWLALIPVSAHTHVWLASVAPNPALLSFKRRYPELLVRYRGKVYIHRSHLPLLQEIIDRKT